MGAAHRLPPPHSRWVCSAIVLGALADPVGAADAYYPGKYLATTLEGLQVEHDEDTLGLMLKSRDGRFFINPWLRGQFRYSHPFDDAPLRMTDFADAPGSELEIRRARLKMEGQLGSERIGFYFEHELSGNHPLLDLRLDFELGHDTQVRIGQYKVLYHREGVDSSGRQQFVERSVSTYAFTLDRQRGITLAKHFAKDTRASNWLVVGVYEGEGRESQQQAEQGLFFARWQWEFLGERLPFTQSDLEFRDKPAAALAFAAATVRGPYTRFSSSGGGQLDGFDTTTDDRYTLRQATQEFAWRYAGMSVQQELHYKRVIDHVTSQRSSLTGGYLQFGRAWPFQWFGKQRAWEVAGRVARVDWNTPMPDRTQGEISAVLNVFLSGHDNKFSVEASRVGLDEQGPQGQESAMRYRVQWDLSF